MTQLSWHFTSAELECPHCRECFVRPRLLLVLEALRRQVGRPLVPRSGYRCPIHNRAVGGAHNSQHVFGSACDIPAGYATVAQCVAAGAIGIGTKNDSPVHVDVRDGAPARWVY